MLLKTKIQKESRAESAASRISLETIRPSSLKISDSNDIQEAEADAVADRVMMMPDKGYTNPVTPAKAESKMQLNKVGAEDSPIQMQVEEDDEVKDIQMKPEINLQGLAGDSNEGNNSDENEEENTGIQLKAHHIQPESYAPEEIRTKINSTKGQGEPLTAPVQTEMESKIGADFRGVRVHTDSNAVQMSKDLGAKAFTHGNDIYFNNGKYDPGSSKGKHLLAHELTHTLQQGALWYPESKPFPAQHPFIHSPSVNRSLVPTIQRVELSYDDGPDKSGNTRRVMQALNRVGGRATFYLVGKRILQGKNQQLVFDLAASGHWLGNHAFDWNLKRDKHTFLYGSKVQRASKILNTEIIIKSALMAGKAKAQRSRKWSKIPVSNRNYINDVIARGTGRFRTPGFKSKFWRSDERVNRAALEAVNDILETAGLRRLEITKGYSSIVEGVDIDPRDYVKGRTKTQIEKRVIANLVDPYSKYKSILLHSPIAATAAATHKIASHIKNRGLTFSSTRRGKTKYSSGLGFGGIQTSSNWISRFGKQVSPIGPAVSQNRTDPIDRKITRQTGVLWVKHSNNRRYLTQATVIHSSLRRRGMAEIRFRTFIDKDIKNIAISKAKRFQRQGIQSILWRYIRWIPKGVPKTSVAWK